MLNSPLKDLRFLVTGSSSGIGAATVKGLAAAGAEVIMVARRGDKLAELVASIKTQLPQARLHPCVLDITTDHALTELQRLGHLDVHGLVNNAGLALGRGPVETSEWSDWEQMFKVNVEAALKLTHAVVPKMLARGQGDILNLCSVAGHWTYPGGAVYCATKHALWAFTKALREETCGKNLRVMQISPGMVETEFSVVRFFGDIDKAKKVYEGMTPLTPADIARQILFMLEQPRHVCIDEIVTMPTDQGSPTTIMRHR